MSTCTKLNSPGACLCVYVLWVTDEHCCTAFNMHTWAFYRAVHAVNNTGDNSWLSLQHRLTEHRGQINHNPQDFAVLLVGMFNFNLSFSLELDWVILLI